MVLKKKPLMALSDSYVPANGMRKYVGGSTPAYSWTSVASELGLKDVWKDLIEFNFPNVAHEKSFDDKCRAVNWLLETRVGCTRSNDGKNYSFEGASPGFIYVPKQPGPKPKPKPPSSDYALITRFLHTDPRSARLLAPANIEPFPHRSEEYIRQRLAAAVRVARYTHLGLATLAAKSDKIERWNEGLGAYWFGEYSDRKFDKVLATFNEIQWYLADQRLDVIGKSGKKGYASALPGIRRIALGALWVSPPFFDPLEDEAERVQTFIHEAAHIAGRVSSDERNFYGRDDSQKLADATMRATRSADNYGYYAIDFALEKEYPKPW
jgi:hypothetical protein